MKLSLRILGSTFLLAVFVLGFLAVVHQDAQAARPQYMCCKTVTKAGGELLVEKGVWFDGKCHCVLYYPYQNPNNCPLECVNWP